MTFYLLFLFLITVLVGLSYRYPDNKNVFQIILLVLVIAVAGFRDYISGDFRAYLNWYVYKTRDNDFEFGFVWIMNLFRWMHSSYHFLFFFFSFCTILLVFLGIKKYTRNYIPAFLFFLLIPALYLYSWSIIRQAFAIALCFYSFYYLINKKYLIYLVMMVVAISMHYSAFVTFIVFLGVYKFADRIKTIHIVLMLFLSLILSQFYWISYFGQFFEKTHYSYYFFNNQPRVNPYKIIVLNLLGLFLLFYFQKMKASYPNQKYLMLLCFFSIIFTNIFATANELNRFSHYFTIFEIIVFADLIFLEIKKKRTALFAGLYLYGVSLFLYTIKVDYNTNSQNTKYIPYNSVFYKFDDFFFMMGTDYLVDPSLQKGVK